MTVYVFYQYLIVFPTLYIVRSKAGLKMLSRKMIRISCNQMITSLPYTYLREGVINIMGGPLDAPQKRKTKKYSKGRVKKNNGKFH